VWWTQVETHCLQWSRRTVFKNSKTRLDGFGLLFKHAGYKKGYKDTPDFNLNVSDIPRNKYASVFGSKSGRRLKQFRDQSESHS